MPNPPSDQHATMPTSIDPAARDTLDPVATPSDDKAPRSEAPTSIGRFAIREEIGAGSFGRVYRAQDPQLDREVAIKVSHAGTVSGERLQRFRREARTAAGLRHPHIVPLFEAGETAGTLYLASAFIAGTTLEDRLRERGQPLAPRDAAAIAWKLADALGYAHSQGVLHRDVKSTNVMLDQAGDPHVLDFGLARRIEDQERMTQEGAILGTPAYLAPEVCRSDKDCWTPAADQYALGVVLYELLTGQTPFGGPTEVIFALQQLQEPTAPSKLNAAVPPDLEAICLKCLEKTAGQRYADCPALAGDLRRWLDGRATLARPLGAGERFVRWSKRNKPLAALYATLLAAAVLGAIALFAFQRQQFNQQLAREAADHRARAAATVDALQTADIASVPLIVRALERLRAEADQLLRDGHAAAKPGSPARLRFALALLPVDPALADELLTFIPAAQADELLVVRDALRGQPGKVTALWPRLATAESAERLRLAALLADYVPADKRWQPFAAGLVEHLVQLNPLELAGWSPALDPIHKPLTPPLVDQYTKTQAKLKSGELDVQELVAAASQFDLAATLLARYAADQPDALAELLQLADERHFANFFALANAHRASVAPKLESVLDRQPPADAKDIVKENLAKRQANTAVALLRMNQPGKVWPLLKHSPDPRVRSYLIHRLSPLGADAKAIVQRLEKEPDLTIRRALLLSLGEFSEKEFSPDERNLFVPKLQDIYRTARDPGLHAASEWLLRTWKQEAWLKQVNDEWAKDNALRTKASRAALAPGASPQWFVNTQGQTFVVIPGPVEFTMGSPPSEVGRIGNETQHQRRIGRTFAVAAKAVTLAEYQRFDPDYGGDIKQWVPTGDCPVLAVTWFSAAEYCNWLSKEEGLPESQWCYEPLRDPAAMPRMAANILGQLATPSCALGAASAIFPGRTDPTFKPGMKLAPDYLKRTGYRLPTEAEMEFATRAGARTARYFGETEDLLPKYAWYQKNAKDRSWPVGSKKPNDLGLLDVQGNVFTWCQEAYAGYSQSKNGGPVEDQERALLVDLSSRVLRGGSFFSHPSNVRSAGRYISVPTNRFSINGFRPARTLSLAGFTALPLPAEGGSKIEK